MEGARASFMTCHVNLTAAKTSFALQKCVGERRAEGKASSHSCENLLKEPSDVYICKNCSSDEMVGYGSLYSTNPFSSTRLEVAGTKECEEALLRIELQLTEFRGALERLAAMMKTIEEKLKFCSHLEAFHAAYLYQKEMMKSKFYSKEDLRRLTKKA
ncbi:hypothetical protein QR680_004924 [Steinernema hermaphroditum]|uniref:Uncharacterized protein n=1 Tax=Steinernema hermaphroditum TaxID=289476 RepID=A0AA39HSH2_9BILA|nr:hypothetical protein QR680_004924 [Steinernema hermaphroditum]